MAVLKEIRSTNWQISLQGAGIVEEGLQDIRQCIDVILRTVKGSDPLRPQFGSDIYQYIDKPVNFTVPNVKRVIIEALGIWEKRIQIVRITHQIIEQKIEFFITYGLVDEQVNDTVQLTLLDGDFYITPPQSLILQALIPAEYQQLLLSLQLDGVDVPPAPPEYGFTTPQAMFAWAVDNWGFTGTWYLLPDKLMLFVKPSTAYAGKLTITTLQLHKYIFDIPDIPVGETYTVNIYAPGSETVLDTFSSASLTEILNWLISTYSEYGKWQIENIASGLGDFDPLDFTPEDFFTIGSLYQFVLYSTDDPGATLIVTTA